MAGTHDDAVLVVEIAKWGAMSELGDALGTIFADDFDPDAAAISDPPVRTVLNFFETVATLVNNDLLDRELVYDWLWVAGPWDRSAPRRCASARVQVSPRCTRTSRRWPPGSRHPRSKGGATAASARSEAPDGPPLRLPVWSAASALIPASPCPDAFGVERYLPAGLARSAFAPPVAVALRDLQQDLEHRWIALGDELALTQVVSGPWI